MLFECYSNIARDAQVIHPMTTCDECGDRISDPRYAHATDPGADDDRTLCCECWTAEFPEQVAEGTCDGCRDALATIRGTA